MRGRSKLRPAGKGLRERVLWKLGSCPAGSLSPQEVRSH